MSQITFTTIVALDQVSNSPYYKFADNEATSENLWEVCDPEAFYAFLDCHQRPQHTAQIASGPAVLTAKVSAGIQCKNELSPSSSLADFFPELNTENFGVQ
jgi:hypothetical protein